MMTNEEKLQLSHSIDNETARIKEELSLTLSQLCKADLNLSETSNLIGTIQTRTTDYQKNLTSFKNKASELSQKLDKLKKKMHHTQ